MNESYSPTDAGFVSYLDHETTSGPGETDVIYRQSSLPSGTIGIYQCDDNSIGSNRCDSSYITFDKSEWNTYRNYGNRADIWQMIACHESGHSVGLTHGNYANPPVVDSKSELMCMRTPIDFSTPSKSVGPWETWLINHTY